MLRKGAESLLLAAAWLRIASHCKGTDMVRVATRKPPPGVRDTRERQSMEIIFILPKERKKSNGNQQNQGKNHIF